MRFVVGVPAAQYDFGVAPQLGEMGCFDMAVRERHGRMGIMSLSCAQRRVWTSDYITHTGVVNADSVIRIATNFFVAERHKRVTDRDHLSRRNNRAFTLMRERESVASRSVGELNDSAQPET